MRGVKVRLLGKGSLTATLAAMDAREAVLATAVVPPREETLTGERGEYADFLARKHRVNQALVSTAWEALTRLGI